MKLEVVGGNYDEAARKALIVASSLGVTIEKDETSGLRFGEKDQLLCLGNNGKRNTERLQVLTCLICGEDSELYPDNLFYILKSNLKRGAIPCGCCRAPKWSEQQKRVLASRAAHRRGYTFIDFVGNYVDARTKCVLRCEKHGEWTTTQLNNLLSKGTGCPSCRTEKTAARALVDDDVHIREFFETGKFHPDTKFKRSVRKSCQGSNVYWEYDCPVCMESGTSVISDLKAGRLSCGCSLFRQDEAYISFVMDGDYCRAIKYGISSNSVHRNVEQNRKSIYNVVLFGVWKFPNKIKCKKAEDSCKRVLDSGILLKDEMSDGWSETTYPRHIDTIIYLYKKYGGVRIKNDRTN